MNYKVAQELSQPIFVLFSYLNSAQHILVVELCRALKACCSFRLFIKLAHSFVAIKLVGFSIIQ